MAKVSDNKATKISKTEPPAFINIPMPGPLNVSIGDTREHFECFEFAWHNYSIASGLNGKPEQVQLCQLVCALGEDAQRRLLQLALSDEQRCTVAGTLDGLRKHLCGSGNMRLDRFEFNRALQRPGESYADYFARLRVLVRRCQFGSTVVEEDFLLDRLLYSIRDKWLGRRMACERSLSLDQAIAWCLRHEKQRRDRQNLAASTAAPELDSDSMSTQIMPLSAKLTRTSVAPLAAAVSTKTTAAGAAARAPQNNNNAAVLDRIAPPSYEMTVATDAVEEERRRVRAVTEEAEVQQRQVNVDQHRAAEEQLRREIERRRKEEELVKMRESVHQRQTNFETKQKPNKKDKCSLM